MPAGLEDHGAQDATIDDQRLAVGAGAASRWSRRSCNSPRAARCFSAFGIESDSFGVMTTVWARNALLLPTLVQLTESGGVQPLR